MEEKDKIKKILEELSPSLHPSLQPSANEDYVITGPLAWPADPVPDPAPSKAYVCDSCYNEIEDVRWHKDNLNFDLCNCCYNVCIRNHGKYIVNSRCKVCVNDLRKILMTKN